MSGSVSLARLAATTPRMTAALPGLPPQGTLAVRLVRLASGAVTDFFEPHFRAAGIAEAQFHVLCLLCADKDGAGSPSELAEMVGTSRANITRLLDQMERKGWLIRDASPMDARRQIVTITDAGRAMVDATIPPISAQIDNGFGAMSDAEMKQLETLLKKLVLSLDPLASMTEAAA